MKRRLFGAAGAADAPPADALTNDGAVSLAVLAGVEEIKGQVAAILALLRRDQAAGGDAAATQPADVEVVPDSE